MGMVSKIVGAVVKRVPPHAKDRAEELLLGLRDFERMTVPRSSALTIVCDDGETRDLDVVEVLDQQGVKGVFAVSPQLIGNPGFLGYDELRQIHAAGHEIAFHGTTHDAFTGFAEPGQLRRAIDSGLARMATEGLGTPRTLIYPYGRHNRRVRKDVAPLFDCAFTTWFGLNHQRANRYAIRRVPFGAYTGKLPATEAWYRGLIEQCAPSSHWPTLMLHPAAPGHVAEHNALLSRLIAHARERGLAVQTVAAHLGGAAASMPGPRAPGTPGAAA